ncbi:MAG: GTPase Era [Thermodesulfobacteria bacterium]|nr:GTPase Era [Thermodesulfobacteriota bacterium]
MDSDSVGDKGKGFKSGFVGIIGAPNVGKSTLLNAILGEKVAITTPKPQTTRTQIRGILTGENFQIVFVDTPGVHNPKKLLNKKLVETAEKAVEDVDVLLFLVDVTNRSRRDEFAIIELIKRLKKPVILVLNKIDKVAKENILPIIDEMSKMYPFEAIIPISAKYLDGIDRLIEEILELLPEGPQYYDAKTITDQSKENLIEEIIREKIFLLAQQEIPYSTAVKVEEIEEDDNMIRIRAVIYVERPSQKGIIIGKGGKFIKKIGTYARLDLEHLWGKKVFLDLWVKVLKDWSKDEKQLRRLGLTPH